MSLRELSARPLYTERDTPKTLLTDVLTVADRWYIYAYISPSICPRKTMLTVHLAGELSAVVSRNQADSSSWNT